MHRKSFLARALGIVGLWGSQQPPTEPPEPLRPDPLLCGRLRIFSGEPPPKLADVADREQDLLSEMQFSGTGFARDSAANANGTAGWFRYELPDGRAANFPIENLGLNTNTILAGAIVTIWDFKLTPLS